jgi:polyketide biosynthesis acyl carrier protein
MTIPDPHQRVFAIVKHQLLQILPDLDPAAVTLDKRLIDLGCNSLDRAEVVTMAMEQLAVHVPVEDFARLDDLRTLVDVLVQHLP